MSDKKVPLRILGLSTSQAQSGSFALVLGEIDGNRRLPIIIGMFEAQAIAIEIEKIKPNRPLTHDLFRTFSDEFNISVKEVVITGLKEGVFFSKIHFQSEIGEDVELDARPSDAVALSLRFDAPIYATEAVLSEAGIILSEEDDDLELDEIIDEDDTEGQEEEKATPEGKKGSLQNISSDDLKKQLADAIKNEDYEKAAYLRDELNKRN